MKRVRPNLEEMKSLLKNFLAFSDRELGHLFFKISKKTLSSKAVFHKFKKSSQGSIAENKSLSKENHKSNKVALYEEYIIGYELRCFIDSNTGWAYYKHLLALPWSFPFANHPSQSFLKPTLFWCQLKSLTSKDRIHFDRAINLIWYGWENYYHFITDILPILLKIASSKFNRYPILVPTWVQEKMHIQRFLELFPDINTEHFVFVPANKYITIEKELVLFKIGRSTSSILYFKENPFHEILSKISTKNYKKIFLTRPQGLHRSLKNQSQVESMLHNYGFVSVDTSNMSIIEQISIFKSVEVCVGLHGAGLTNLCFAENPPRLIELFPQRKQRPQHYEHQIKIMKGKYSYLSGSKLDQNGQFSIDESELNLNLQKYIR